MGTLNKVISALAITVTLFGFFFAVFTGSYGIALFQLALFALNVHNALKNRLFTQG